MNIRVLREKEVNSKMRREKNDGRDREIWDKGLNMLSIYKGHGTENSIGA